MISPLRWHSVLCISCFIVIGVTACSTSVQTANTGNPKLLIAAKKNVQMKELPKALTLYDEYFASIPKRGKSQIKQGERRINPYFYALQAGDIALKLNLPRRAATYYSLAHKNNIREPHFSDRIRLLARWHEERAEYNCSLDLLEQFQELDPELFLLMADRISKSLVDQTESKSKRTSCPNYWMLRQTMKCVARSGCSPVN